jgi:hypothetical protein
MIAHLLHSPWDLRWKREATVLGTTVQSLFSNPFCPILASISAKEPWNKKIQVARAVENLRQAPLGSWGGLQKKAATKMVALNV